MVSKRIRFNKRGISGLSANKPVVYKLLTPSGNTNYIGSAKRCRVRARLAEHLPGRRDSIPASTIILRQFPSIGQARASEKRMIKINQPKYNKLYK